MTSSKTQSLFVSAIFTIALLAMIPGTTPAQKRTGAGTRSTEPAISFAAPDPAQSSASASAPKPTLADFAWLEGRWQGTWGPRVAEQCWTSPKAGMMLGTFRLVEDEKTLVLELFSLVEKQEAINIYSRHFTPVLVPWEKTDATFLKLVSVDATKSIFENSVDGEPKHSVITRVDADTYISRSEIVPENGDMQVVEITYHRQKPAATPPPSGGNGAHR